MYKWVFISILCSCRTSKDNTSTESPEWWETETVDTAGAQDDTQDEDDKDSAVYDKDTALEEKDSGTEDVPDCGDDFDQDEPCVGDWSTTLCMHEGTFWWCENNVWLSDEDK